MYLRGLLFKLCNLLLFFREAQLMQNTPARGLRRDLLNKTNQFSLLAARRLRRGRPSPKVLHARQTQSPLHSADLALAKPRLSCEGITRKPRPQSEVAEPTSQLLAR